MRDILVANLHIVVEMTQHVNNIVCDKDPEVDTPAAKETELNTSGKDTIYLFDEPVMGSPHLTPGRPILSVLPSDLVGDVLEVWEFLNRFHAVLGIGSPLSIEELEGGLRFPMFDDSGSRWEGMSLNKVHCSLLKVLIGELQPKVAAIVRRDTDSKRLKLQKTRKKDVDMSIAKDTKLSMPVHEFNWQYLAWQYILAVLSMDRSRGSPGVAIDHSGNALCCSPGGGPNANMLRGSLTGVVGMEADASFLAQALRKILGPLDIEEDMLFIPVEVPNMNGDKISINSSSSVLPQWAELLLPVREAPTNSGARIRNCVRDALKEAPPEWAKKKLEDSISKEVYVGNACGPTKRAVKEVLDVVCREGKLESYKGKKENYACISDLIMKKCRLALRVAATNNRAKFFYNLRWGQLLSSYDGGIIGAPAVASRPLDFRTIDTRLALGAYDGSHEAFFEDVQELWSHIRVVYHGQPDLLRMADKLSSDFEKLYRKEVLHLRHKLLGYVKFGCLTPSSKKVVDEILDCSSKLPKSPWEDGICKVCGVDEHDDLVLLCDEKDCNDAYHTYCLNPPFLDIPEGDWFCPSCTTKGCNVGEALERPSVYYPAQRKCHAGYIHLASALRAKEYGQLGIEERISLLKFLCDELLDTDIIRKHILEGKCPEVGLLTESSDAGDHHKNIQSISEGTQSSGNLPPHMKLSLRRELLGRDSTGRLYWILGEHERCPWIIMSSREKEKKQEGDEMIFDSGASSESEYPLLSYQTGEEVSQLLEYLRDDDPVERELKDAILRLDVIIEDLKQFKKRGKVDRKMEFSGPTENRLYSRPQDTKAFSFLENEVGPWYIPESVDFSKKQERRINLCAGKYFFRCSCWELIWTSRHHCLSCHRTFPTSAKLERHSDYLCKLAPRASTKKTVTEAPNVKGLMRLGSDGGKCTSGLCAAPGSSKAILEQKDKDHFTIPKAAVEPVVGKDAEVLMELKVNLLDMDAALPEAALRPSKAKVERRWAWRAFVKSAKTIYEVVQAMVVFEDTIRSDYFVNRRPYCSSVSAASSISTVTALALRIGLLDASICYEKKPDPKQVNGPDNKPKQRKTLKRKRGQKCELAIEDGLNSGNN